MAALYCIRYQKQILSVLVRKERIKTGTTQDKAVFVFILFLLIPLLLFLTGIGTMCQISEDQNLVSATGESNTDSSKNNDTIKNNFNLNFEIIKT